MALTKVTQHSLGNSAVTTAKLGTAPFAFANSSANIVFMAANGNIGINTSTPIDKLTISSGNLRHFVAANAANISALFDGDTSTNTYRIKVLKDGSDATAITFGTQISGGSFAERMRIHTTGDVGIGTATPAAKLDLAGAMRIKGYQGTAGTLGDGYHASRFWIELMGAGANGITQKLFYADDNAAFKITYMGHFYNGGAGNASMLRAVEFYGAVGSGGANETGVDYYFVNAANYGTAGNTDTPSFSVSGDAYVQITYGTSSSSSINSRGILIEWFGNGLPTFHPTLNAPT